MADAPRSLPGRTLSTVASGVASVAVSQVVSSLGLGVGWVHLLQWLHF